MDVRFVLVRTRNPLHIGAAARAMANFGFSDMNVVHPFEGAWREARSAVGAAEVLRNAQQASLSEAVGDCHLVFGTTAGSRRAIQQPLLSLREVNEYIRKRMGEKEGRIAVLFGSEKTGLSNRDFEHCHALLRIPTGSKTPSMNLAQAVAVVAYELALLPSLLPSSSVGENRVRGPSFAMPTQQQIEDLVGRTRLVLEQVDYMQHMPVQTQLEKLRRAMKHWHMTRADAALLRAVFKRASERLEQKK